MRWRLLAWGLVGCLVLGVYFVVRPPTGPSLEIDIQRRGGDILLSDDETVPVGAILEGPKFGDADATKLAGFPSIRSLSIQGSSMTGDGLRQLLPLTKLRVLNLNRTQLAPESLDDVAKFASLQKLHLAHCPWFRDDDLRRLAPLQQLEELDLSWTTIGAAGVEHLRQLPSLRSIVFAHCFTIQDDAIEALCRLPKIEVLDLTSSEISSGGLARLRRELPKVIILLPVNSLRDVRHLSSKVEFGGASGNTITSMAIKPPIDGVKRQLSPGDLGDLAGLTDIASITLNESNVDDAMLLELGERPALKGLFLRETLITDDGLKALAGFPNLSTLHVVGARIEGPGLRHLENLTQLQHLVIKAGSEDDLWDALKRLTRLSKLEIQAPVTDAGLLRMPPLPRLSQLEIYDARIAGQGLAGLAHAETLEFLFLTNVPLLQEDSFIEGLAPLKVLRAVYLNRTGMTREGCERLWKLRPKLHINWYDADSSEWVHFK